MDYSWSCPKHHTWTTSQAVNAEDGLPRCPHCRLPAVSSTDATSAFFAAPGPSSDFTRADLSAQTLAPEEVSREQQESAAVVAKTNPPAGPATVAGKRTPSGVGPVPEIPGYEILGVLGRGGMGVVYKARQIGLNRLAALKMIVSGAHASDEDRTRFRTEAEAVAHLKHPNIVQVYEIGEHHGLPFFSLEYLDGGSLAGRLDGAPLPARAAARLVELLARAMQHAHESGIVHRDLKPANILLQLQSVESSTIRGGGEVEATFGLLPSGSLVPKITDFGLAKRIHLDSGLTESGAILGTPSYMAPEQADGRTHEAGPAVDTYALGAILYELLTGRPPFRGATPTDTILQVRTLDPVPPSRWQPNVPRDLETICLKCLEKSPEKRFHSAGALADDLRRFLDDEPILARPTRWHEHARKWARRNPAGAALIGLSAAVVVALVVGGLAFARHEQLRADEAEQLRAAAERQRDRANENFLLARAAVDQLLTRVGAERLDNEPRMERMRRELLETAIAFHQKFLRQDESNPELRREAGRAHQAVGQIREMLGELREAAEAYRSAIKVRRALAAEFPDDPEYRRELIESLRGLSVAALKLGDRAAADDALYQAENALSELSARFPNDPRYRLEVGMLWNNRAVELGQRDPRGAAEALRKAIAALAADESRLEAGLELARARANLAAVLFAQDGRADEALAAAREAVEGLNALWIVADRRDRRDARLAGEFARAANNLASLYQLIGRPNDAGTVYSDAVVKLRPLVDQFPDVPDYRHSLALVHMNRAELFRVEPARAAEELTAARRLLQELVRRSPTDLDYRHNLLSACEQLARVSAELKQLPTALSAQAEAAAVARWLADDNPRSSERQFRLGRAELNYAQLLTRDQQNEAAEAAYDRSIGLLEPLTARSNARPEWGREWITARQNRANLLAHLGQLREAVKDWRAIAALFERMSGERTAEQELLMAHANHRAGELSGTEPERAMELLMKAVRSYAVAWRRLPADQRGVAVNLWGSAAVRAAELALDAGERDRAIAVLEPFAESAPDGWPSLNRMAALLARAGRTDRALDVLERAVSGGFRDRDWLERTDAFAPLREDPRWRAVCDKMTP